MAVKRAAVTLLMMLATAATAAVVDVDSVRADAASSSRMPEGRKTQWAPTRNFSVLNARAVFASESRAAASPYAREAAKTAAGGKDFTHDALGSVLSQTNTSGTNEAQYDAWGSRSALASNFGSLASSAGFTGHRLESALGFSYAKRRWLDSTTGTWLSRDDVGAASYLLNPNEQFAHGYGSGNPMRFTDPSGRNVPPPKEVWRKAQTQPSAVREIALGVGDAAVDTVQSLAAAEHAYRMAQLGLRPDGTPMPREKFGEFLASQALSPGSPYEKTIRGLNPAALLDPRVQQDLILGLPELVQGTGEGLGEGASLAVDGKPREASRKLTPALLKTLLLVQGGRGLGGQAAKMGLLEGTMLEDFALPATRQTLNPRNWTVDLYENALGSGPPVKKFSYVGPKLNLLNTEIALGLGEHMGAFKAGLPRTIESFPFESLSFRTDSMWGGIARAIGGAKRIHFNLKGMTKAEFRRWLVEGGPNKNLSPGSKGWTNRELYEVLRTRDLKDVKFYNGMEPVDAPVDWLNADAAAVP